MVREITAYNNSSPSIKNDTGYSLKIWPQYAAGNFYAAVSSPIVEQADITLSGLNGQVLIRTRGFTRSVITINSGVPQGIYLITARTTNWSCTEKVIVR